NRLESMRYTETKVPPITYDLTYSTDSVKLQPPYLLTVVRKKNHFIRSRTRYNFLIRRTGEVDGTDLVGRPSKKSRVLPGTIKERAVVAVAELKHPLVSGSL